MNRTPHHDTINNLLNQLSNVIMLCVKTGKPIPTKIGVSHEIHKALKSHLCTSFPIENFPEVVDYKKTIPTADLLNRTIRFKSLSSFEIIAMPELNNDDLVIFHKI